MAPKIPVISKNLEQREMSLGGLFMRVELSSISRPFASSSEFEVLGSGMNFGNSATKGMKR
jgi:hypothetical protein